MQRKLSVVLKVQQFGLGSVVDDHLIVGLAGVLLPFVIVGLVSCPKYFTSQNKVIQFLPHNLPFITRFIVSFI